MLARTLALALLVVVAIGATASAQTLSAAAPGAVEPSVAFVGPGTAVALRNNGDVLTWGRNDHCALGRATTVKQAPDPTPTVVMHNAKAIYAGNSTIVVLSADGKVYSWGPTKLPMPSGYHPCDGPALVPSLAGKVITHVGLGVDFGVAVTDSGDLYCFGRSPGCPVANAENAFTRLSIPTLDGRVLNISVGLSHTLVLTRDRALYAFGQARWGQLGDSRLTQGGAGSGGTADPVLTNVVSFAAGNWHSVAAKDDGTVWTWGHNEQDSELCDGTTTNRRVPTQLTALPSPVVQVAANGASTFLRTKEGALYACGSNVNGRLGLEAPPVAKEAPKSWLPVRSPRQVPAPAVQNAARAVLTMGVGLVGFSPDGCAVHIAGEGMGGVRGAREPSSPKFVLRTGVSLCAPRPTTPMPDIAENALHPAQTTESGVDCWIPRVEQRPKDAQLEPLWQAMLAVERVIKANQAFTAHMPERVRMQTWINLANGSRWLDAAAYPRQFGSAPYWTPTGCDIVRTSRSSPTYEHPLGHIEVWFNRTSGDVNFDFGQRGLKPVRIVAGLPVFRFDGPDGPIDRILITKDGRLPIVPLTMADWFDQEALNLSRSLAEVRKRFGNKAYAAVETQSRQEEAEYERQIRALGVYRASFSADDLRAAWVHHDPQGRETQELEARVRAFEALSLEDQAQVNDLGTRARMLQRQALTRGTPPEAAARLRNEANTLLQQAAAIKFAQRTRALPQVMAVRNDFSMKSNRPGPAADAAGLKDDSTFWDAADPNRIQLITVKFSSEDSRAVTAKQAKAWMDQVEATFDYQALKALIR